MKCVNVNEIADLKQKALGLFKESRFEEARFIYAEICKADISDAESWFRMGTAHLELNALHHAEACFRRVIELRPNLVIAYYNLGRTLELQEKDDEALVVYQKLLQLAPNVDASISIGTIYQKFGRFTEALELYQKLLQSQPDNFKLILAEAGAHKMLGEYDKAYSLIEPFLEVGRESPAIALLLASISRHLNRREQAIDLLERVLARDDLAGDTRAMIPLHFALGDQLDARGDYDRAFQHYERGNNLSTQPFDVVAHAKNVDDVIRTFNEAFVRQAPRAAVSDKQLVFIVGMPRSGTTLVEQILSSHHQVWGCGELLDISLEANHLPDGQGNYHRFPYGVAFLTHEVCTQIAKRYIERVTKLSGDARFITDKMPQNFGYLGFIAMLFPYAKIIHCMRDPLDTCLSCYIKYFRYAQGMAFTTDMTYLGTYYKQYQRLMQHWKAVLDIEILDLRYEEMVENQEGITRELLSFCGLPWDEKCLKFYDSGPRSAVVTASYDQVRQPMNRKSVQRWKHYDKFLEPLKKALFE